MNNEMNCVEIIEIEIGKECNLASQHKKCPINYRTYNNMKNHMTYEKVISLIDEVNNMEFNGYIAFHYYNEPLLYKNKIERIIDARPNNKYLLWTNGTLLDRKVENNDILRKFNKVVITCYDYDMIEFYKQIQNYYKNVQIATWALDDRAQIYCQKAKNSELCERVLYEFPIDYYGNVHLCSEDWNNQYMIGNVFEKSVKEIINSEEYKRTQNMNSGGKLIEKCPEICKRCNNKAIKEKFDINNIKGCI